MSRISVTEKQHWKERIDRRLDQAIAAIEAKDPTLIPKIDEQAAIEAHKALGTHDFFTQIEGIKRQIVKLKAELEQLEESMYRKGTGTDRATGPHGWHLENDFWTRHRKQNQHFADELLQQSNLGKQILALRAERDALLDTVWLATSNTQIRNLWNRVATVLGDAHTPLQQQILDAPSENANS